jgi:hypothetical protein
MGKMRTALKLGPIVTAGIVVWLLFKPLVVADSEAKGSLMDIAFFCLVPTAVLFFAIRARRVEGGGQMTFAEGLMAGLRVTAVYTALSCLFFAVLYLIVGLGLLDIQNGSNVSPGLGLFLRFLALTVFLMVGGTAISVTISVLLKRGEQPAEAA